MENALRTKSLEVKEQYEKQLRELQEAYGEAMLELRARNKLASLLGNEDELRSDNGLVVTSRSDTALVGSYGLQQEFITSYSPE